MYYASESPELMLGAFCLIPASIRPVHRYLSVKINKKKALTNIVLRNTTQHSLNLALVELARQRDQVISVI